MSGKSAPTLDKAKVLENAVTSIQLGIEDYELTQGNRGNPLRAVSAARNLFAGVLLLFKYKISTLADSPEHAAYLIYKARKFKPCRIDSGKIEWRPELEKNKTIDVSDIRLHFEGLGIRTDWTAVNALQTCRNDLEHLHLKHPLEDINKFLLDLFPLLRDFITHELSENPAALLGATWEVMLKNHEFFARNRDETHRQWAKLGVMEHTLELFKTCVCRACGSPLLEPNREDIKSEIPFDYSEFRCSCVACNQTDPFIELMAEALRFAKEDPFSEEAVIIDCSGCGAPLFDSIEGYCHLCGHSYQPPRCSGCNQILESYEAEHGALCDRCSEYAHYDDEYEPHIS
ncbi:hypothetical protein ACQKEK_09245 [Pseudomonas sp. NPDC077408]